MAEFREIRRDERTLGELFAELSEETSALIRQQVQLAKVEFSQKAAEVGRKLAFLAVGAFLAYAGLLALIAALILGLAQFMAGWLAALLVGIILAAVAYALIQKGISDLRQLNLAPQQTLESLEEDKEWLKRQI